MKEVLFVLLLIIDVRIASTDLIIVYCTNGYHHLNYCVGYKTTLSIIILQSNFRLATNERWNLTRKCFRTFAIFHLHEFCPLSPKVLCYSMQMTLPKFSLSLLLLMLLLPNHQLYPNQSINRKRL